MKAKYGTQREYMRTLFQKHGRDKEKVCAEFAQAVRQGNVLRRSNLNRVSDEHYAQTLWYYGIKRGWNQLVENTVDSEEASPSTRSQEGAKTKPITSKIRTSRLTPKERTQLAKCAAQARWRKRRETASSAASNLKSKKS